MLGNISLVRLIQLNTHADSRGKLTAIEGDSDIPFEIRRLFYVHDVAPATARAAHAHPDTEQCLIAISGALDVEVRSPDSSTRFHLDDRAIGLYVPAMLWVTLDNFSSGAVCLGAASTHYVPGDVIRDWDAYLRLANARVTSE